MAYQNACRSEQQEQAGGKKPLFCFVHVMPSGQLLTNRPSLISFRFGDCLICDRIGISSELPQSRASGEGDGAWRVA
jgi:hypothetical protein